MGGGDLIIGGYCHVTCFYIAYYFGNYILFVSLRIVLSLLDILCIGWVGWGVSLLFSDFTMLSDLVLGILHWVLVRDEW